MEDGGHQVVPLRLTIAYGCAKSVQGAHRSAQLLSELVLGGHAVVVTPNGPDRVGHHVDAPCCDGVRSQRLARLLVSTRGGRSRRALGLVPSRSCPTRTSAGSFRRSRNSASRIGPG